MQVSEKITFAVFFDQFCVINGKISSASHHLKKTMEILPMLARKNREDIGIFLFEEGKKL